MQKRKAYRTAILGVLIAIIFVQSMVPFLGFIPTGFINITIIHITVIVAAIVLGPKDGAIVGLVWGIGTVIRAFTSPTSIIDTTVFTNPIVAILPNLFNLRRRVIRDQRKSNTTNGIKSNRYRYAGFAKLNMIILYFLI